MPHRKDLRQGGQAHALETQRERRKGRAGSRTVAPSVLRGVAGAAKIQYSATLAGMSQRSDGAIVWGALMEMGYPNGVGMIARPGFLTSI